MRHLLFCLAAVAAIAAPVHAQALDAAARKEVVDKTAGLMRSDYVFPDVGAKAAEKIEAQLAAGAYNSITEAGAFAQQLTADLRGVTNDKHLTIRANGVVPPPPAGGAAPMGPPPSAENGITRVDRLAGGVGYVEIVGFPGMQGFKETLDRALAPLKDAPSIIIDIRRNGGGSPESVAYLVSYFLDGAKPQVINTFHSRTPGTTTYTTRPTMSQATPVSLRGKPLYVLTSGRTFSGGEEFAYDVQAFKLGTLVGETTGGGANPVSGRQINARFGMSMPGGRPINPVTGTNWEGVGVKPEVAVPAPEALETAMRKLGQSPIGAGIDQLTEASLFRPRLTQSPGTEEAVRRAFTSLQAGTPDYTKMSPGLQQATRQQLEGIKATLEAMGPLESVTFLRVVNGGDLYAVTTAYGAIEWQIALNADGVTVGSGIRYVAASEEKRQAAFTRNDANRDGKLDKAEYTVALAQMGFRAQLEQYWAQRDVNADGFISAEEYKAPIQ